MNEHKKQRMYDIYKKTITDMLDASPDKTLYMIEDYILKLKKKRGLVENGGKKNE